MVAVNHTVDPSPRVEAAFRRIWRERMADLPMLNPCLDVEAVAFSRHDGHWLGVLVTPWSLSLFRLPGGAGWTQPVEGKRLMLEFPAGTMPFLGGDEPELGEYQSCALIADMSQFPDRQTARLTALASRQALMLSSVDAGAATVPAPDSPAPDSPARRRFLAGS